MMRRGLSDRLVLIAKKLQPFLLVIAQLMLWGILTWSCGCAFGFSPAFSKFQQHLILCSAFGTAVVCAALQLLVFWATRESRPQEQNSTATTDD